MTQFNSSDGKPPRFRQSRRTRRTALAALAAAPLLAFAGAGEAAAEDPLRLLALGTSLTAGYGLAAEDGFTAQLQRALAAEGLAVEVLNAGVSGDTTAGGLARLDWALADQPDAVIVELGSNDGLRGIDPAVTQANLEQILTTLSEQELPVLLTGMYAPPNMGQTYGDQFNAIFPDLAAAFDVDFYPFFLEGVAAEAALNQDDGIHPNPDGVALIVENLLPAVRQLLERAAAARTAAEPS